MMDGNNVLLYSCIYRFWIIFNIVYLKKTQQKMEDLEKKCMEEHKQSCEFKTPIHSIRGGLSTEEQRVDLVADYMNDASSLTSQLSLQHFIEITIALVLTGLLVLLCNSISQKWLNHFYIKNIEVLRPV